ncbi:g5229 [Coccomyxa elongata]
MLWRALVSVGLSGGSLKILRPRTFCAVKLSMTSEGNAAEKGRMQYRPHLLTGEAAEKDWVQSLELTGAKSFMLKQARERPLRTLILYGSLRNRSYSRLLAYEFARILDLLGAEVRVFDPSGLPIKDDASEAHPKVVELRELSMWSEAHVWCCPEQHGTITAVFKNQIDWIPLSLGSVRPTQGRTLAIAQVNGGSQSFNTVNILRVLGRWMRMVTIPNQSSVPKAWTEFDEDGRMKESGLRDRVVDVAEELYKFSLLVRDHSSFLVDRYSERKEKREKGRLLSQAEKEAARLAAAQAAATANAAAAATAETLAVGAETAAANVLTE